jgi:glycosyltransferase involved in cell wall biosynthesis
MNCPKISIIIPVYNTSHYLSSCFDSILQLDETNFEVIIVDDGSNDGSGKICDEYASKDERFVVFHQENKGVSAARNLALGKATGEWISFIDSDDIISHDFFNIRSDEENCDVIVKSYKEIDQSGSVLAGRANKSRKILGKEKCLQYSILEMSNPLWDKVFKRCVIGETRYNEEIRIEEDFLFGISVLQNTSSIAISSVGVYIQCKRNDSAMSSVLLDKNLFLATKFKAAEILWKLSNSYNRTYITSLFFKRFFPFLWGKSSIFYLSGEQLNKLQGMISIFDVNELTFLPVSDRIKILVRVYWAKLYFIMKKLWY